MLARGVVDSVGIHSASKGCGGQCGGYIVLARGVVDSVGDT